MLNHYASNKNHSRLLFIKQIYFKKENRFERQKRYSAQSHLDLMELKQELHVVR